jgi:hypothetical protein
MYGQHNLSGLLAVHLEKRFENLDDELHGRVVVVEQNHFIQWWFFKLGLGFFKGKPPITTVLITILSGESPATHHPKLGGAHGFTAR